MEQKSLVKSFLCIVIFSSLLCPSNQMPIPVRTNIPTTPEVQQSAENAGSVKKIPEDVQMALTVIHDINTGNFGTLCATHFYQTINIPVQTLRYDNTRQKADMAASFIQQVGLNHHGLLDATCKSLVMSDKRIMAARILSINSTTGTVINSVTWKRPKGANSASLIEINGPVRVSDENPSQGARPNRALPWYEDAAGSPVWSPKFQSSPASVSFKGWWTFPYYSCAAQKWLLSYSIPMPFAGRHDMKGFLSLDVDISNLEVNQCDASEENSVNAPRELSVFHGTHKCHSTSMCKNRVEPGLVRGGYDCVCKPGYYHGIGVFNGTLVEAAYEEKILNESNTYDESFVCKKCAPGCRTCKDASPCLAPYNWTFRSILLLISLICAIISLSLIAFVYNHRKMKVIKTSSPLFLSITLAGCALMYLEMVTMFPVLNIYCCIMTKWIRHLGFCITFTALLMKTWRVSLTYRVKSAHKVKLTDRQLLQWMYPVLFVMVIYLGAWTIRDPPRGEMIKDRLGLEFKQCSFNWWDHTLAIGEFFFLVWGVRICYSVRHAESYFNEARFIGFAVYNIATVNVVMVIFHLLLFPQAGPDFKYLLDFIRTQLSTSVTIMLVFGTKIYVVWKGSGDKWDTGSVTIGMTPSVSLNGVGVASNPNESLERENEDLKEEVQKLACQVQFMKIIHMETNNRHLKPKPGSPFQLSNLMYASTMLLQDSSFPSPLPHIRILPGPSNAEGQTQTSTPVSPAPPASPASPTSQASSVSSASSASSVSPASPISPASPASPATPASPASPASPDHHSD